MARPKSELTKFILSLSRTLSTKEVIAKAKLKGFVSTESNVHRVRNAAKNGSKAPAPKAAAKKSAPAPKAKAAKSVVAKGSAKSAPKTAVNKSDFVRAHGGQPAKEVVAKAKAQGVSIDESYVYKVRGRSGAKAGKKRGPGRPPKHATAPMAAAKSAAPAKKSSANGASGGSVKAFRAAAAALVLEHGLGRAKSVLDEVSSRIRSAVG